MVLAALALGMLAGTQHALSGPDHLAGVAPFAARRTHGAWRVGIAWGAGHALGACGAALLALALRSRIPGAVEHVSRWSEIGVGITLCVVGALGLHGLLRARHTHEVSAHATLRRCCALGLLHGAAGLAHVYAVLPALALPQPGAYLIGYALASTAAISALAQGWGRLGARAEARRWLLGVSSAASLLVGVYWLGVS